VELMTRARRLELVLLALCAAVLALQLFIPPYIGIANNGDFGRVCARFSLAPADGWVDNFRYFVAGYYYSPANYWRSDFVTSEILLAAPPALLVQSLGGAMFNIRWMGAVHAALFVAAYALLLFRLRPLGLWRQAVCGLIALWIFADAAYVAYFNSFYSDTAAILGLLLAVAAARRNAGLFVLGSLLFITSKGQHAMWGFVPAVLLFYSWRVWPGVVLLAASIATLALTPSTYRIVPVYDIIFQRIAAHSTSPLADLRELGLGEDELRLVGTLPSSNQQTAADLLHRTGYGKIVRFYLRHPARTLWLLHDDLRLQTFQIRPQDLSNFQRQEGHPPYDLTTRFASWSGLRSRLFIWWPEHILLWYALFIAACIRFRADPVWYGVAALAILEFLGASLADGAETFRHLIVFHLLTDITFAAAIVRTARAWPPPGGFGWMYNANIREKT
jgi:hypothetical protein